MNPDADNNQKDTKCPSCGSGMLFMREDGQLICHTCKTIFPAAPAIPAQEVDLGECVTCKDCRINHFTSERRKLPPDHAGSQCPKCECIYYHPMYVSKWDALRNERTISTLTPSPGAVEQWRDISLVVTPSSTPKDHEQQPEDSTT